MGFPVILYRSILRNTGALITASSSDTGFVPADVADLRAWKLWKAGATTSSQYLDLDLGASGSAAADYILLVNHNLVALGATMKVYADTVTPPTNVAQAAYSPAFDSVDYKAFTSPGAKRYWRFEITKGGGFASKPYVGELMCGLRTTLPEFVDAGIDPYVAPSGTVEAESERSAGGQYLGAVLRGRMRRGAISFGSAGIARSFFTSDLSSFIKTHADLRYPFGLVLDPDDSEFTQAMWVKMPDDGKAERAAVGGTYARFSLKLPFEEAFMEAAS